MQFADEWLVPALTSLVPESTLDDLRRQASGPTPSVWQMIIDRRILTDDQVLRAVSERFRMPVADLGQVDRRVIEQVPEQVVRKYGVFPIRATNSWVEIATANPFDIDAEKMLAFATGLEVRLLLASPAKIRDKIEEVYRPDDLVEKLLDGIADNADVQQLADEPDDLTATADEARARPIIKLVDTLLADGITSRASDVHVEPTEGGVIVRYRIDGVLREVMKIPRSAGIPLISRIKIMSGMDIADRLRPQDGRCRVAVNGQPVDLRVSTLPASLGEKVVIRILNAKATVLDLESLGYDQEEQDVILGLLQNKEGILLVTGPTGSGKTTTLYAALRTVQNTGVNIVTVEDPVEYRLGQNIVQVQINERAGLTFPSALRSILRQDPDVVLIGEIRDRETAQIAVQASLTGHLVLSTLHTNDAPNTITRLLDIGMEAYKIGSALRGIVAQRLMRKLCPACRAPDSDPIPSKIRTYIAADAPRFKAVGCSECSQTGYRGRFAIVEVLVMTETLERLIASGATADQIASAARADGMRSLFESALRHVLLGTTSVEEVLRVTDPPREPLPDPAPARSTPRALTALSAMPEPAPSRERSTPAPRDRLTPSPSDRRGTPDPLDGFELVDDVDLPPAKFEVTRRGAVVLLVDDEDQLRRVMRDLLERQGYTVLEARDGAEALAEIDRTNPDLMLLDLNLPGVDGYTVLSQVRSREATRNLPIVVLTAKGDEDNEVRVLELGADDFLTKPFRARALAARLQTALARSRGH
ncbi:MAG: Flp pilus assembly complex ATPase component TadA [Gemmatimonadales bacterium]|nr:Flp pilus assembly complex ATPase component TadA [Gemmatimonadales bacterium]